MKLFKETPVNDGYKTLQDDIKKTTDELQIVYTNLENVVEPDLIDYTSIRPRLFPCGINFY